VDITGDAAAAINGSTGCTLTTNSCRISQLSGAPTLAVFMQGAARVEYQSTVFGAGGYDHTGCSDVVFSGVSPESASVSAPVIVNANFGTTVLEVNSSSFTDFDAINGDVSLYWDAGSSVSGTFTTANIGVSTNVKFRGSAESAVIGPSGNLDFNGASFGTFQASNAPGTYTIAMGGTTALAITIGDNVALDLSGATYDPQAITIPGTGFYYDKLNARSVAVSVGPSAYTVLPRNGLVSCDNSALPCTVNLLQTIFSGDEIVIQAQADPSINNITINTDPADLFENGTTVYTMNLSTETYVRFAAIGALGRWVKTG
jgi:hypothetical protein